MSVFGSFSEKGVKDAVSANTMRVANYAMMAFIGALMLFLSLRYVLPNDVFTSALFFDGLGLQPVFDQPAAVFAEGGLWPDLPDVTTEAIVFASSLLIIQIFAGYRASMAGPWDNRSGNVVALFINSIRQPRQRQGQQQQGQQQKKQQGQFNWTKFGWMSMYWIVALFDTATDAYYRSGFGSGDLLLALVVSFLFYNLFSEWAVITGAKTTINYGLQIINIIRRHAFSPPRQQQKGQQQGNKNQGKPQQQVKKDKGAPQQPGQSGRKNAQRDKGKLPGPPQLRQDLQDFLESR